MSDSDINAHIQYGQNSVDLPIPAQVKHDLIDYYADPQSPIVTKNNLAQWAVVQANLKTLGAMKTIGDLDPVLDAIQEDGGGGL